MGARQLQSQRRSVGPAAAKVIFACMVLLAVPPVSGMVGTTTFSPNNRLHLFDQFCFAEGTADWNMLVRMNDNTSAEDSRDGGEWNQPQEEYPGPITEVELEEGPAVSLLVCNEAQLLHLRRNITTACTC